MNQPEAIRWRWIAIAAAAAGAVSASPFGFAAVAGIALIGLGIVFGYLPIFAILFTSRSALDAFTEDRLVFGPLVLNGASVLAGILLVLAIGFWIQTAFRENRRQLSSSEKTFLVWLAILVLGVVFTILHFGDPLTGVREWLRIASIMAVLYLSAEFVQRKGLNRLLALVFVSGVVPITVAVVEILSGRIKDYAGIPRVRGTFYHPITFSLFLALFIALTLWKMRVSPHRMLWRVLLLVETTCLIATFSLTGLVVLGVMAFYLLRGVRWQARLGIVFGATLLLVVFAYSHYGSERLGELSKTGDVGRVIATNRSTNSLTWRIWHWYVVFRRSEPYRWTGAGLGSGQPYLSPIKYDVHNDLLRIFVEMGPLGLICYGSLLLTLLNTFRRLEGLGSTEEMRALGRYLSAFGLGLLVASVADNVLNATAVQYYVWAIVGGVSTVLGGSPLPASDDLARLATVAAREIEGGTANPAHGLV